MKPANFPARKVARQLRAALREDPPQPMGNPLQFIDAARAIRTKKRRTS
jgi:hypothetical protein